MKFRIVKEGLFDYRAQVTEDGRNWVTLSHCFTQLGAEAECRRFASFCRNEPKEKVVDEFEISGNKVIRS